MIDWTIEQIRRTAAQMAADNPELSAGQLAVESDARMAKVGPGRYSELPYLIDIDMVKADAAWETDRRDVEGSVSATPFLYLNSGSSTSIHRYQGQNEGKPWYVKVGETATAENPIWSVIWSDIGGGLKWYVSDGIADALYSSDEDVATPDLVGTWTLEGGVAPLPSIALYPGPTVQDALEQVAKPSPIVFCADITQIEGDAPTINNIIRSDFGEVPELAYLGTGQYSMTFSSEQFSISNAKVELSSQTLAGFVSAKIVTNGVIFIYTKDSTFSFADSIMDEGAYITITRYT